MSGKVLVIDDDIDSGKTMMWAMESAGHSVQLVHDGQSALHKIQHYTPDVVLCDLKMPGMHGWEICEKMKRNPSMQNTLFIAQTGMDSPQSKERSAKAGFKHHLVKPVDINFLLELVYRETHH